jgi:stage V sporulation protein SpoVS
MLRAPGGATIEAMARAAKWQPHSVRGFLAGVVRKKLGLTLVSAVGENARVYRITDRTALDRRWTTRLRICAISISMACGRAGRAYSGNSRLIICPAISCLPFSATGSRPMSWAISIPPPLVCCGRSQPLAGPQRPRA